MRWPTDAMHEHDTVRALDNGRDDWNRVAPVYERALRACEPRLTAALDRRELASAERAVSVIRIGHS
jgi:hypothetical protein